MKPYILASASPRRREICALANIPVEIRPFPADVEPLPDVSLPPEQAAMAVARAKTEAAAAWYPDRTVIGADTSVWLDGDVLGKPHTPEEAASMLRRLQGRAHHVLTAVWVCSPSRSDGFCDTTQVTFYPMTEEEIAAYVSTGEPMDKAGAYGIQGQGLVYIRSLCGDYYTVMGLSGAKLKRFLQDF